MSRDDAGAWEAPALVFLYRDQLVHVSEVSRTTVTDRRERAILRALLLEALRLLDGADVPGVEQIQERRAGR